MCVAFIQKFHNRVKEDKLTLCSVKKHAIFGSLQSCMCSVTCFVSEIYMSSKLNCKAVKYKN